MEASRLARLARLEDCEAAPPAPQQILERPDLEACRRELRAVLRVLARRLQRLRARLAATLAAALARRAALRASLPGLGPVSVAALVAGMRKLSVLAAVLLRQDRLGSAQAPLPERARGRAQRPGRALLAEQRLGAPGTDAKARFRA